ncbi:Flp family type IVb pilin [Prosthecomicrobium sp. N25]|uniref:Flp family type IVb pilin n=1 Tax=Prosthecomicrobium sp. N25 TaxID=3129254 RepID=UPI0030771588
MMSRSSTPASLSSPLRAILKDESGATAIEYGLIASLVVIAILVALAGYGDQLNAQWTWIADTVLAAMTH